MSSPVITLNTSIVSFGECVHNEAIIPVLSEKITIEYSFPTATNFDNQFIALSEGLSE